MQAGLLRRKPVAKSIGSTYRPDIDGLRAIAVLSVVMYHVNKNIVPGGYVGVDIFFVISGFLITGNIWSEIQRGKFSLVDFYVRRIHRIYPAFAVVTAFTLAAGCCLMLAPDLVRLARSAFWAAFSAPNVYFWKYLDTSYFAPATEQEPLLHMWSLGVEEQFYFVWPVLLLLLSRAFWKSGALAGVVATAIGVLSFAYAQEFLSSAPKFTYYMLPARAGELLFGAVIALFMQRKDVAGWAVSIPRWIAEACSVIGLLLLACSMAVLDSSSDFPGVNSIWPCLGAGLLIVGGSGGAWISRTIMSFQGLVFVGLISYSLYLWHWPVLAFIRYFYGHVDFAAGVFALVFISVTSWLSYRFVEIPARRWRPGILKSVLFVWLVPLVALAGTSLFILSKDGFRGAIESSEKYRERVAEMNQAVAPAFAFDYVCQVSVTNMSLMTDTRCVVGAPSRDGPVNVLLWGDSKASQFVGLFDELGKNAGVSIRNIEHSSCPPVFADDFGGGKYRDSCNRFWRAARPHLVSGTYKVVLLGGSWEYYSGMNGFSESFQNTLSELLDAGVRVVFITDVPRYPGYNRECLQRGVRVPWSIDCGSQESVIDGRLSSFELEMLEIARSDPSRLTFLDAKTLLCTGGICRGWRGSTPLYFDEVHISLQGGRLLGRELLQSEGSGVWLDSLRNVPGTVEN